MYHCTLIISFVDPGRDILHLNKEIELPFVPFIGLTIDEEFTAQEVTYFPDEGTFALYQTVELDRTLWDSLDEMIAEIIDGYGGWDRP